MQSYSLGKGQKSRLLLEACTRPPMEAFQASELCHAGLSRSKALPRSGIVRNDCHCAHYQHPLAHPAYRDGVCRAPQADSGELLCISAIGWILAAAALNLPVFNCVWTLTPLGGQAGGAGGNHHADARHSWRNALASRMQLGCPNRHDQTKCAAWQDLPLGIGRLMAPAARSAPTRSAYWRKTAGHTGGVLARHRIGCRARRSLASLAGAVLACAAACE